MGKVKVNDEKQTKRSFKIGDKWKISYVHDDLFIELYRIGPLIKIFAPLN